MLRVIIGTFGCPLLKTLLIFLSEAILRILISVLILQILNAVSVGDTTMGFAYVAIICFIWYLLQLASSEEYLKSAMVMTQIKSALAMMLYAKISNLTSYMLKSSQMGKITNLLANDLGAI